MPGVSGGASTTLTPAARSIAGTVTGNAVTSSVGLAARPSVGSWVGHYQTGQGAHQLAPLWILAVPDGPPGVGSTLTGSTGFVRQRLPS